MTRWARLALWLHERSLAADEREAIAGDLVEGFAAHAAADPRRATRWLWSQLWRSVLPNLQRRWRHRAAQRHDRPEGGRMLNGLTTDLRFAVRLFKRQPLTSLVALVSLTVGLAFNILLATVADAVLFRPLPLRSPGDLALLLLQRETGLMHNFSYAEYRELRDQTRSVRGLVAYSAVEATMTAHDGASPLNGEVASGNFFATLGVPMIAGRALAEDDDRAASPPAIVISEALWRGRLAAAPLAGQVITLNGQSFTVVGVAADRFAGMQIGRRASFWVPLAHSPAVAGGDLLSRPTVSWLTLVGRLHAGSSRVAARDELDAILGRVRGAAGLPLEPVVVVPGARGDSLLSTQLFSPLVLLLGAGAVVLLVACLNVANLQLARTESRRLELAVRSALGARRSQLVRLVLLDGALLASIAGVAGVWLSVLAKDRAVSLIALHGQPVSLAIPFDGRVIAGAFALSFAAAAIVGLFATWRLLRDGRRGLVEGRSAAAARRTPQRVLVAAQIALSMALITGAALLVRTLDRLRHVDLGFDSRGVAVVQVSPEMGGLTRPQAAAFFDEAIARAVALPGVQSAALAHVMPLDFGGSRMTVDVAGYESATDEDMELNFVRVSPGYFRTLGIVLLHGRTFDDRDHAQQPDRIVVNETMARRFWPDGRAVGRFVRLSSSAPYNVEVIGVVRDAHYRMVREEPQPSFYVALRQYPSARGVLHVRYRDDGGGDPAAVRLDELRRAIAAVNPAVPVIRIHTLVAQIERNIADERMALAIGFTLALVALVLATAGLYATMAFLVGRRTREIGVRLALGARASDVRALVLREGTALAIAGVGVGVALSAWVGYALRHQLYAVQSLDVASLASAAAILCAAAVLASWLPARRASRVDPVVALRE
jgi:predicted permease